MKTKEWLTERERVLSAREAHLRLLVKETNEELALVRQSLKVIDAQKQEPEK